jgi:hypothetical protein
MVLFISKAFVLKEMKAFFWHADDADLTDLH